MSPVTFDQVYELAQQLTSEEQQRLAAQLRGHATIIFASQHQVTRESLIAEFERKKAAGLFKNQESLFGKYANPNVDISEEEMNATLREIRDQWKEDMDELDNDSE